jgi:hypothetical protein
MNKYDVEFGFEDFFKEFVEHDLFDDTNTDKKLEILFSEPTTQTRNYTYIHD